MKRKRGCLWYDLLFSILLISFSTYALLDTFVISHSFAAVSDTGTAAGTQSGQEVQENAGIRTETSYEDDQISIQMETIRVFDTTVYVADVQLASADYLKTALARDTCGTNVTQTTSSQASSKGAILAVNGDYYGASDILPYL